MITVKDVQKVAELARIQLSDKEVEGFKKDLNSVLDYFSILSKLNTKGVEPMTHAVLSEDPLREDIVKKESGERIAKILKMVPNLKDGYVKVRSILNQRD